MNINSIKWVYFDGYNNDEITKVCSKWEYGLCPISSMFKNLITGEHTLFIEPADTMRGSGKNIPVGSIIDFTSIGNNRIIQPRKLTEKEHSLKSELERLVVENISYQKSDLRMSFYNNKWFISFYLIDLANAPYEWHGETTEYEVDFNKSFFDNLLFIKKNIEDNGVELEW